MTEASLLRQAGHQVTQHIVSNPKANVAAAAILALAPWNPLARSSVLRAVSTGFDVAHVHNTWYALSPSVLSALKRSGLRVVMTAHNYRLACINAQLTRDGQTCLTCVGSSPWPGVRYNCYRGSKPSSAIAASAISLNRRLDTWNRSVDAFLAPTPYVASILEKSGVRADRIYVKPHLV